MHMLTGQFKFSLRIHIFGHLEQIGIYIVAGIIDLEFFSYKETVKITEAAAYVEDGIVFQVSYLCEGFKPGLLLDVQPSEGAGIIAKGLQSPVITLDR